MRLFWRVVGVPALGLMALALAAFGQGVTQVRLVGDYQLDVTASYAVLAGSSSNLVDGGGGADELECEFVEVWDGAVGAVERGDE
jgi:hypothetical protein